MADLGIDGRGERHRGCGAPTYGGLGAVPPVGVQGAEPPLGSLAGKAPQKLKPKNTLEASWKALW